MATFPELCPQTERALACETDADCDDPCIHQCADGTPARLDASCDEGVCRPRIDLCGLAGKRCPAGTRPHRDCLGCGPVDACAALEISCAEVCESDADCTQDGAYCAHDSHCDATVSTCDL